MQGALHIIKYQIVREVVSYQDQLTKNQRLLINIFFYIYFCGIIRKITKH